MAIGSPLNAKSYIHQYLEKRRRSNTSSAPCQNIKKMKDEVAPPPEEEVASFNQQLESRFFQELPIEIRRMIYAYVWQGRYDHLYHIPEGRHIHFKRGHWTHTRCVMSEYDEDLDFIQKQMDTIRNTGRGDLLMWQRRLASTWGRRHWRCEERVEYGQAGAIDRTDLSSMMMLCKRMVTFSEESRLTYLFGA
ncbi:Uu.00g055960.m01.CDS01 [Anthostomella pinea]|uniref:Uu.00g055960.m01.CDS01 n=1 Tax=Anthostomella pinea TaxID=933095 RepID=A0AAI8VR68_9PEZI|nr:Uu.00g055960.m01.CDS01 [Anthostomella pinea]